MTRDRFLTWDFDGTLARRPGNWTGVVCEVVAAQRPDLQGARAVGMRAILVRQKHPEASIQCETLHAVADVVGE